MIYQGDNHPTIITLDDDLTDCTMRVSAFAPIGDRPLKLWSHDEMGIAQNEAGEWEITCPWTEDETAALPEGDLEIEVKGWDADGLVMLWERKITHVAKRKDRRVRNGD